MMKKVQVHRRSGSVLEGTPTTKGGSYVDQIFVFWQYFVILVYKDGQTPLHN